jgi:hypothetical protein
MYFVCLNYCTKGFFLSGFFSKYDFIVPKEPNWFFCAQTNKLSLRRKILILIKNNNNVVHSHILKNISRLFIS